MLLDLSTAPAFPTADRDFSAAPSRWGVDSEYGRLTDVLVAPPPHLRIVPCNDVAVAALGRGLSCCPDTAMRQHRALIRALEDEGVRCHAVPAAPGMPDLCFTRDTSLMTPWGLLPLRPSAPHRRAEVAQAAAAARRLGVPMLGGLSEGRVEGGDVCMIRPGLIAIGWSGERTDAAGATALARLFEARGWTALVTRFDRRFLHLDTIFSIVGRRRALSCIDALEPAFVGRLGSLGIAVEPVTCDEVRQLGCNLLSLGGGRLLSAADNVRVNRALAALGYRVIALDVDQFTRCGGGIHCLTMPLARLPG